MMIHERLLLFLYAVGETSYESLELPQRRLSCWVVSFVQRGEVVVTSANAQTVAVTGTVMIHPPNQFFGESARIPGRHQWFLCDAKDASGLELLRRYPLPRVLLLKVPATFERRFAILRRAWEKTASPLRDMRVTSLMLELFAQLFDSAESTEGRVEAPAELSDRFERVVNFMQLHLSEPLRRRDLAGLAHLHPTHFDRAFRKVYGLTPMQMLREFRLRRARELLETTNDTLETIADASGFYDAAYLSRTFKTRFERTPGDHRRRVKSTKRGYISALHEEESVLHSNE